MVESSATIVIVTRNRKEMLCRAVRSAVEQAGEHEVLVLDDGSEDGSAEMLAAEWPTVKCVRVVESQGYIRQRNHAAVLARHSVVVSIDDDAVFSGPNIVNDILSQFDSEYIGVVTIPVIDKGETPRVRQIPPADGMEYVTDSFVGTAHAVWRDLLISLGGYREELVHQGEERDLSIRMLENGYLVRLGRCEPIWHFESPIRNWARMDYFGRRNDLLFAWQNVPFPDVLLHIAGTTLRGLWFAIQSRRMKHHCRGILAGYTAILCGAVARRPVSRKTYRITRWLRKRGPREVGEVCGCLRGHKI